MQKWLPKLTLPFLLCVLTTLLLWRNFSSGTFLSGWDNLHPEFYPTMNLQRAWQSAWQEYQGLGLLAGMAHSADFFRQLLLFPLSLILPMELFRYGWHFLMVLIGVLGSFYLFRYLLRDEWRQGLLSFLGASFYLLNFATVQSFYTTFEPFATFYAFLPFLLLSLLKVLYEKTHPKRNLWIFVILSILATAIAYVQTIFIVYFALVCLLLVVYFLQHRQQLRKVLSLFFLVLAINVFWLLSVLHFTITSASLLADSKGKAMSNDVLTLKNQAFGDLPHLLKMQGFWLGQTDFDEFGNTVYLFDAWKTHFANPLVTILAWGFFALVLLGLVQIFRRRQPHRYFILLAFLLSLWMMSLENFPFSILTQILREILPLFSEMFRINFTKWVVPFSLFYSLLLMFGLQLVFEILRTRFVQYLFALVFLANLIFYSWPSFAGHFFYDRLRVKIPKAYFDLFTYFRSAPASSRIANLPQYTFYSWQWNDWGYRGSGILWYGIKQPILDRAFDVWSEPDERYYWQLQTALDKKDVSMVENVFSQYDVDYVLIDSSVVNRNTVKPINYQALKDLLLSSSKIKPIKDFDFLSLYSFSDSENNREKDFVSLYQDVPIINNTYHHAWSDQSFANFHDYLSFPNNPASQAKIIVPFPSLFTNHLQKDLEFKLEEDIDFFYLSSAKLGDQSDFHLDLPNLLHSEAYLPFALTWQTDKTKLRLRFKALLPEIYFGDQKLYFDLSKELVLDNKACQHSAECFININNQLLAPLSSASASLSGSLTVPLSTKKLNTIALSSANKTEYFDYAFFDLSLYDLSPKAVKNNQSAYLTVKIPKVMVQSNVLQTVINGEQVRNCRPLDQGSVYKEKRPDGNYYLAIGTSVCDQFYIDQLKHDAGYLVRLEASNLRSIPFVFALQVDSLGRSPLETYLSEGVNYQLIPPLENFNFGYTLYLSTDSYGREINDNLIKSMEVFIWPYNFLDNLYLQNQDGSVAKASLSSCDFAVAKKALWLYQVDLPVGCSAKYLKLSQAYDRGWLAWRGGFGGAASLSHVKFNNWANGWVVSATDGPIYIFFWPQLLEYFGFGLLGIGVLEMIAARKKYPRGT